MTEEIDCVVYYSKDLEDAGMLVHGKVVARTPLGRPFEETTESFLKRTSGKNYQFKVIPFTKKSVE